MRVPVRPLCFVALLGGFAATAQSQPEPQGGVNQFYWAANSPGATLGGVDASAIDKPATGYTCTEVVLRVVDDRTGKTLDSYTDSQAGGAVSKSFTGLESGLKVQVTANATFQGGTIFDLKFVEADVTTK